MGSTNAATHYTATGEDPGYAMTTDARGSENPTCDAGRGKKRARQNQN